MSEASLTSTPPFAQQAYGGDIDTIDTILDQGVPHRKKDKFGLVGIKDVGDPATMLRPSCLFFPSLTPSTPNTHTHRPQRPEDWAHFMGHGEAEAFLEEFKPTMDLDRYAA